MPRKLFLGHFQPDLESALAAQVKSHKKEHGPFAPLCIAVPTRLLGLHLQRTLARQIGGHCNLQFTTLADLALRFADLEAVRLVSPLGLEMLARQIARDAVLPNGYFEPVRDTKGFPRALLDTFTDLKEAVVSPDAFAEAANSRKLRELAEAYAAFCRWLDQHNLQTEADLFLQLPITNRQSPIFLYGFYDLNFAQRDFIRRLKPEAVFFPWAEHGAAYAQPLLDWFKSQGYSAAPARSTPITLRASILSCPGETAEAREAVRETMEFIRDSGGTFNDVAILFRSRDQYDAILRDTLGHLGIKAYFRGGRPLAEQSDARLVSLLLETIRTDFSRASVMELACHLGPRSHWDALSVELGIVGGQQQWLSRLDLPAKPRSRAGRTSHPREELEGFLRGLFAVCDRIPKRGSWSELVEATLASCSALGSRHEMVNTTLRELAELDLVQSPVTFDLFSEFCATALDTARLQTEQFQGGGLYVGDLMGARGLSWPLVIVLGLVEKSFPRVIREDPLLLDAERAHISPKLPLKRRGYDEEHLLFDLAASTARDKLVLSFPRLDSGTGRPRVPSSLLLARTGATTFKALEEQARRIPLAPVRAVTLPLDTREFDLPALCETTAETYLGHVSPLLPAGLSAARARWRNRALTAHDGLIVSRAALELLRERFVLEKLVISATSLEEFFRCPFYYFQKHVIGVEPWVEPEAALTVDPADLGSLYHKILEDYYRQQPDADLAAILQERFTEFERSGVTGYTVIWELRKQIIREEVETLVRREQADAGRWRPKEFERAFDGIAVAPPVRLRGKIDRIDQSADGSRLRVLDYKTGRFKRGLKDDDFARGEALQLALYLLAAQRLFPGTSVESASYLYFTLRGGYRTVSFSRDALAARESDLHQLLQTAADMMRDGVFAQHAPTRDDPCRLCDFRPICGNGIHKLYQLKNEDARMASFRAIKEETA